MSGYSKEKKNNKPPQQTKNVQEAPDGLPENPETGRSPLLPGCTGVAAGSQSSPGQIDRSCSPGYTDHIVHMEHYLGHIIKSQPKAYSSTNCIYDEECLT